MRGVPRYVVQENIWKIARKFLVRGAVKKRPVPHVTLFGPFRTHSIKSVIRTIVDVAKQYDSFSYEIDGFGNFDYDDNKWYTLKKRKAVIYLHIRASENMQQFRRELAEKLLSITYPKNRSNESLDDFKFHSTVAINDIADKFDDIWDHISKKPPKVHGICYRITLLKEGRIICEYDLVQKRKLNRQMALDRRIWKITYEKYSLNNKPHLSMNSGNKEDTILFYECPDCFSPDIQNNSNGSAHCEKCGFRT